MNTKAAYLFLDDIRFPDEVAQYTNHDLKGLYLSNNWVIVKSYQEFLDYLANNPMPGIISFDHDLGLEKSGYDCAKWLIDFLIENKTECMPEIYCHSMNPVGKENILSLFWSFERRFNNGFNCDINCRS